MGKTTRSRPDLFGGYQHYDSDGKKTGHSDRDLFGGFTTYDENNKKTGHSEPSLFGGYDHYDKNGKKTGYSVPSIFGGYIHYDEHGKWTGSSDPELFGGYRDSQSGACYIATCVYGSYDCPEVWTLRRYRDMHLAASLCGRTFIRCYYAAGPLLVRFFGKTRFFRSVWKRFLDRKVLRLNGMGYKNTPYSDTEQAVLPFSR